MITTLCNSIDNNSNTYCRGGLSNTFSVLCSMVLIAMGLLITVDLFSKPNSLFLGHLHPEDSKFV